VNLHEFKSSNRDENETYMKWNETDEAEERN